MSGADTERVLFVDDDPQVRAAFARSMRLSGFLVDVAESSEEALLLASHCHYAVVVADWRMPGRDGLQLRAALQASVQRPRFVLVTAADTTEIERCAERFDCPVFSKPWDENKLRATLRSEIEQFQNQAPAKDKSDHPCSRIVVLGSGEISDQVARALAATHGGETLRHVPSHELMEAFDEEVGGIVLTVGAESDAVEQVRRMSSIRPSTPILVVADSEAPPSDAVSYIRAGAEEFLTPSDVSGGRLERSMLQAIARKRADSNLVYQVNHDALTGVANRTLLTERLARAVARTRRAGSVGAVMFLDLDRFKPINDTYGHDAGDALLKEAARRIQGSVRDTDTVARIGGDEFAVVLEGLERPEGATLLAQRIVNSFATPFIVNGVELCVTTSVGIAVFPHNGTDVNQLLKHADSAMYRAKEGGRNSFQYFSEGLHSQALRQQRLQREVRSAVEREDFSVEFQPQLRLSDQRIIGCEAFLRWPRHYGISTTELVGVLEEAGLSQKVGDWMLRKVCAQLKAWNGSSGLKLRAAVNVAARQFLAPDFVASVASALAAHELSGSQLELEINETILLNPSERLETTLAGLKRLGVRLILDDFGVDCSSLGCILRYEVDGLKLDRALVEQLGKDERAGQLASAVIAVARCMRLGLVAEGVETEEQMAFLRRERCIAIQGYYLGQPCRAAEMTEWLSRLSESGVWNADIPDPELAAAG